MDVMIKRFSCLPCNNNPETAVALNTEIDIGEREGVILTYTDFIDGDMVF